MLNAPIAAAEGFHVPDTQPQLSTSTVKSLNFREIWAIIYRSRWWVVGIVGGSILLAVAYALLTTRLYDSSVSIEVRQEAEKVLGTEADREGAASKSDTDRFQQTQLDIIRSRGVATAVAQSLGFFRGGSFFDRMKIKDPEASEDSRISLEQRRHEAVINALRKNLKVEYTGNTRIAQLTFRSPDAELSAQVANSYADNYIRSNLTRKFNSSSYALDFLRNQLREAQGRLEVSEQDALRYARETRIVDVSSGATGSTDTARPQSLVTAQLVQLNQVYATAVAERIQAQQRWERIAALPVMTIPEVLANPAIQTLLDRRAQARATYEQQRQTRQEDYPAVRDARAQVTELNAQVSTIAANIRSSVRAPYDVALARERQISAEIERLKSSTLTEQNQGIQLSILRREADTNRQQYDALLRRYNALNAESGVQTNNLSIVDRADVPQRPAWPKLPLVLALALAVGLVLSAIVIILREQLFDAVRIPEDVTDRLNMPLIGTVPQVDDARAQLADPKSAISESYGSIRTMLSLATASGLPRSLMVTSAQAGEGKSTACYALAISLARAGIRVLVVDIDIRRPNMHNLFDLPNTVGVTNVIAGQVSIEDATTSIPSLSVDVLTTGGTAPNPAELINSKQMLRLIDETTQKYDIVLFDSAPVLALADAVILSARVDATVFVIETGRNTVRNVIGATNRLRSLDSNIVGAILTKFDPGRLGYGNGDDYAYTYRYDYSDKAGR